jgi:ribonuclease Y
LTLVIGCIIAAVVGLLLGAALGRALGGRPQTALPEAERTRLLEAARTEAEQIKRSAELEGKEIALKLQEGVEAELLARRQEAEKQRLEVVRREGDVGQKAGELQRREDDVARKERALGGREQAAEATGRKAEEMHREAKTRLEKLAGMSADQAREELRAEVIGEAKQAAAGDVKKIEDEARLEADARAKRIVGTAIQRYASEYVAERTVSVVPLPSDDLKGRIIGREGRNIRALEAATGIDLIIDDTPEAVIISCFNPLRREVAKMALTRLIADGRIHPTRIEEVVAKCEAEVEQQAKEAGEQAVFDLGLGRVHPELVKLLGRLRFRSSYAQNLLQHSVEVGYLAGVMAAELGQNVKLARRAGLLHDIGKAVDQDAEGSHAAVGAAIAKKHGESPRVVRAIASHHGYSGGLSEAGAGGGDGEGEPRSVLDHIVDACNQLSEARPGARREQLQTYVSRLEELEKLCASYDGVERAYAIQMGREVRVLVENSRVSDEQAALLSKDIAKRIEGSLSYPGQIRVCVIRETRSTDYAR